MLFACIYMQGSNWQQGKPVTEQPLQEHTQYMLRLHAEGKVAMAGPLIDNAGGLNIFEVATQEEAQEILHNDPAIRDGICRGEIHPWHPLLNSYTGVNLVASTM
jgi:uncharacterized protein YciI